MLSAYHVSAPLCYVADNCASAVSANTQLVDITEEAIMAQNAETEPQVDDAAQDEEGGDEDWLAPDTTMLSNLQTALQLPTDSIGCHCHALELAIGDALKNPAVSRILSNLKEFITAYKRSSRTQHLVRSVCGDQPIPFLPPDVSTRWTSTFRMIDAFLTHVEIFKKALEKASREDAEDIPGFTNLDIITDKLELQILTHLRDLLYPVAFAVNTLQGDTYPTLSLVQILVDILLEQVKAFKQAQTTTFKRSDTLLSVLKALEASIRQRFLYDPLPLRNGYMPIDYIASALDPRTKALLFLRDDSERECVWEHILKLLQNLPALHEPVAPKDESYGAFADLLRKYNIGGVRDPSPSADLELSAYRADRPTLTDPLAFWKVAEGKYPRVALLARNYLAVPASSATVERVFSRAGNAMSLKRTTLSEGTLQAQTCFKSNDKFAKYVAKKWANHKRTADIPDPTTAPPAKLRRPNDQNE